MMKGLLGSGVVPVDHNQMGLAADKMAFFVQNRHMFARHGGVIRWKGGTEKAGAIFAHLRDSSELREGGKRLVKSGAKSLVTKGASSALLGLTGIGAVASVVNLGVSAAGFYVMNKKLNQLDEELKTTQRLVSQGFDAMEARFVQVQYIIEQVAAGQETTWEKLDRNFAGISAIQDSVDARELARLSISMEFLAEHELGHRRLSDHQIDDIERDLKTLRARHRALVEKWCLNVDDICTPAFGRGTGFLQEWGLALIAEARLLRMTDRTEYAIKLLELHLTDWYYPTASVIADKILGDESGILLSSAFGGRVQPEHFVALEAFRRGEEIDIHDEISYLAKADKDQGDFFGRTARDRRKYLKLFDPRSTYSRAVQAYNLMELGHRMSGLASEYDLCHRQRLSLQEWEEVSFDFAEQEAQQDRVAFVFAQ